MKHCFGFLSARNTSHHGGTIPAASAGQTCDPEVKPYRFEASRHTHEMRKMSLPRDQVYQSNKPRINISGIFMILNVIPPRCLIVQNSSNFKINDPTNNDNRRRLS